jgi:FKBP-type peptidyl-prolyl cis-trans isomerase FkpA
MMRRISDTAKGSERMSFFLRTSSSLVALAALSAAAFASPLAQAAEPVTTATGLVYEELVAGSGEQPTAADRVRVHYVGTFADGSEFDSSVRRGQPAEFPLGRVIKCWTEGVQRMKVGGKARLTCPAAIAYGDKGAGGVIPPGATIYFEVELLGVSKP